MSTDTAALFIKTEWISLGGGWGGILRLVKHAGKKGTEIPPDILAKILPSSSISIPEMLNFTLPNQITTANNLNAQQFFSHNPTNLITEASIVRL